MSTGGRRTPHADRFLTTVLFTDIVGSTELASELGDRGWKELLEEHNRLVRTCLRRYGGTEIDTAGDGFFATFDAPAAAVSCALEIASSVQALGIAIRAGVHVGEVERVGAKVGGIAVSIGARIMAAAGPGEVLVSGTVRDLAAGAGLSFTDRGVQPLKGVPGAWQLHAAAVADGSEGPSDVLASGDQRSRRAAAVRRARDRPIWRRRPKLVAAAAAAVGVAIAAAALVVWSPWRPAALGAIQEDAVGIIDPSRNEIVAEISIGSQPGAIAAGEGSVWVTSPNTDTVRRIDPRQQAVIDSIEVGAQPLGVAVAHGSVWVANSGARTVSRINAATGRVVDTIEVGNGPRAIAVSDTAVWVANASDGTVTRLDPAGSAGPPMPVGTLPAALLVHEGSLWVASEDASSVTRLDPETGRAVVPPIAVGARPLSLAGTAGSVWVANAADGTLSRIDTAANRVVDIVDVGGTPITVTGDENALWVGDSNGAIRRVDPSSADVVGNPIGTGSSPYSAALIDGRLWVVTISAATGHAGGTLRVVSQFPLAVDRVVFSYPEVTTLIGDGLVAFARHGGIAGSRIVPGLATSVPRPTDGGTTYTFQLRSGLLYSDGSPVRASDFRRSVERSFQTGDPDVGPSGPYYFSALQGADACADAPGQRCDLATAVEVDDATGQVTFRLRHPDPDFLFKLASATSPAIPLPPSVPMNAPITEPYPVTGPYKIESMDASSIRLTRNPHFQSVDTGSRPLGLVDEILWTWGIPPSEQLRMVRDGEADYMADGIPPDALPELQRRYMQQLHRGLATTTFVFLNTRMPPFDRLDVRQAVTLAIDRSVVAELRGGPGAVAVTCQILPPNFPGYEPYCPFTADPGPGGQWTAPDLARARALVDASGTKGAKVAVGPFSPRFTPIGEYLTRVLDELGFDASYEPAIDSAHVGTAVFEEKRVQVGGFEWFADYPAPDTFLAGFTCSEPDELSNFCDPELDAALAEARALQTTDPPAAIRAWAEFDRKVTDLALWIPLVNEGTDFVSARVRNYQHNVAYGILLDQVWVE